MDIKGVIVNDTSKIITAFTEHFQNIYSIEPVDKDIQLTFLDHCREISQSDQEFLETPFTIDELKCALDSTQNNKSPGPDGLTFEFYKAFSPQICPLLLRLYSDAIKTGQLPTKFNEAFITLLPKKTENNSSVNDYRPISLLNTDYKLLTKMIFLRLKPFITDLIGQDQYCSNPDRNIDEMTHFLRDFISYCKETNLNAAPLSIDQEKAFDRVDHSFLFQVIDKCKIGSYLSNLIKLLQCYQ